MYKLISIFILSFCGLFGQTPKADCFSSTFKICDTTTLFLMDVSTYPNLYGNILDVPPAGGISNPNTNPASLNSGCLLSGESRPTWAIFEVLTGGTFGFSYGHSGGQLGFNDWILWPYDTSSCNKIKNNLLPPVRCNWNATSNGGTGIGTVPIGGSTGNYEPLLNVNAGDKYIICINDYSNVNVPKMNFIKIGTCILNCGFSTNIKPIKNSSDVNVYPNPSDNLLFVKSDGFNMALIYDCLGNLVIMAKKNEVKEGVNVSALANGIYFIELIESDGQKSSKKIVIQH